MRYILKILFLFVLLTVFQSQKTFAQTQTLVLWHADGTTTDIALYTMPQISFNGDKVMVKSPVLSLEYPKAEILRFTYKGTQTAINSTMDTKDYRIDGDKLLFNGVSGVEQVALYTAGGVRVPVHTVRQGSSVAISLSGIPSGVYLLNVNGKTAKFTKP